MYSNEDYLAFLQSDEWKGTALERMKIDKFTCQGCGSRGSSTNKLQVHHWNYKKPLGQEEPYPDLVCLCQSCHLIIHNAMNRITSPDGRRGWKDAPVPQVHTYTLSGLDTNAMT